jgi:colanic acid biosynthesis protein WcaH
LRLDRDEAFTTVRLAPIVSIDLIVEDPGGRILVGLRCNQPAAGTWFVPGGRVLKGETLSGAFSRIALDELSVEATIDDQFFLGVFEHFYGDNFLSIPGVTTHYIALAYVVHLDISLDLLPVSQHREYRWMAKGDLLSDSSVHQNTKAYVEAMLGDERRGNGLASTD